IDVTKEFIAGYGLVAAAVAAGGGEHFGDFGAAVGAYDELGSAADLAGEIGRKLAYFLEIAIAHDDRLGGRGLEDFFFLGHEFQVDWHSFLFSQTCRLDAGLASVTAAVARVTSKLVIQNEREVRPGTACA